MSIGFLRLLVVANVVAYVLVRLGGFLPLIPPDPSTGSEEFARCPAGSSVHGAEGVAGLPCCAEPHRSAVLVWWPLSSRGEAAFVGGVKHALAVMQAHGGCFVFLLLQRTLAPG